MIFRILKFSLAIATLAGMFAIYNAASSLAADADTTGPSPAVVTDIIIHYDYKSPADVVKEELMCLAKNIYFEAGTESTAGKVAVAIVTMNRVKDNRWPSTICGVVKQGPTWKTASGEEFPKRHLCQFSWYCDGKGDEPYQGERWQNSLQIAEIIYFTDRYDGMLDGATHYHATYVDPSWAKHLIRVARVDTHIFYR